MDQSNNGVETKVDATAQTAPAGESTGVETPKVDETTEPVAPKAEENTPIDYKAELTAAQERIKKAERTIVDLKRQEKQNISATSDVDLDFQVQLTPEEMTRKIESEVNARLESFKKDITADVFEEELARTTDNTDERELTRFHYENSIKQSGVSRQAIAQDLKRARLLANERALYKENLELKAALIAKQTAGKATTGTNQDRQEADEPEPKFTPQERALLQRNADKQGLSLKEYIRRNRSSLTAPLNT